jgi:hypothetical protein
MRFPETNAFFKNRQRHRAPRLIARGIKSPPAQSSHFEVRWGPVTTAGRFLPFDGAEGKALRRSTQLIPSPVPGPGVLC